MIINFRVRGISRDACKLTWTFTLIKKNIELSSPPSFTLFSFFSFFFFLIDKQSLEEVSEQKQKKFQ
jgi:hypothetical protein